MLIVIMLCAALMPVVSYSSEGAAPSYWQRVKNYVAESRIGQWYLNADPVGRKRLQSVAASSWTWGKRGALIGVTAGGAYGLSRSNATQEDYMLSLMTMGLGALAYNVINEAFNAYNKGFLSQAQVVAEIKGIINSRLLTQCSTNEEKLELLANRDYFIEEFKKAGKTDKELETQKKLIDQVFSELTEEIKNTGTPLFTPAR